MKGKNMLQENEFRVRPVDRFVLTHYQAEFNSAPTLMDPLAQRPSKTITRTIGEFPNVESAEEVGVALQALVPGSSLTTIDGRTAEYPPAALAAAMAVRHRGVGDVIDVDGEPADIYAVHEFCGGVRRFDVTFRSGRRGGSVVDHEPYNLSRDAMADAPAMATHDCEMQYTIVERTAGVSKVGDTTVDDVRAKVYYAEYAEEAEQHRQQLQAHYDRDFRIFSRRVPQPRWNRGPQPSSYPPLTLPAIVQHHSV